MVGTDCYNNSLVSAVRQGLGFMLYTQLITFFNSFDIHFLRNQNQYIIYSIQALFARIITIIFGAPLTLIKTRL